MVLTRAKMWKKGQGNCASAEISSLNNMMSRHIDWYTPETLSTACKSGAISYGNRFVYKHWWAPEIGEVCSVDPFYLISSFTFKFSQLTSALYKCFIKYFDLPEHAVTLRFEFVFPPSLSLAELTRPCVRRVTSFVHLRTGPAEYDIINNMCVIALLTHWWGVIDLLRHRTHCLDLRRSVVENYSCIRTMLVWNRISAIVIDRKLYYLYEVYCFMETVWWIYWCKKEIKLCDSNHLIIYDVTTVSHRLIVSKSGMIEQSWLWRIWQPSANSLD